MSLRKAVVCVGEGGGGGERVGKRAALLLVRKSNNSAWTTPAFLIFQNTNVIIKEVSMLRFLQTLPNRAVHVPLMSTQRLDHGRRHLRKSQRPEKRGLLGKQHDSEALHGGGVVCRTAGLHVHHRLLNLLLLLVSRLLRPRAASGPTQSAAQRVAEVAGGRAAPRAEVSAALRRLPPALGQLAPQTQHRRRHVAGPRLQRCLDARRVDGREQRRRRERQAAHRGVVVLVLARRSSARLPLPSPAGQHPAGTEGARHVGPRAEEVLLRCSTLQLLLGDRLRLVHHVEAVVVVVVVIVAAFVAAHRPHVCCGGTAGRRGSLLLLLLPPPLVLPPPRCHNSQAQRSLAHPPPVPQAARPVLLCGYREEAEEVHAQLEVLHAHPFLVHPPLFAGRRHDGGLDAPADSSPAEHVAGAQPHHERPAVTLHPRRRGFAAVVGQGDGDDRGGLGAARRAARLVGRRLRLRRCGGRSGRAAVVGRCQGTGAVDSGGAAGCYVSCEEGSVVVRRGARQRVGCRAEQHSHGFFLFLRSVAHAHTQPMKYRYCS
eukprot:Rhum_TRINITY_DN14870_c17_g1::Rhum_TRINITY_DN14870_c17_g1_i1::g.126295::m.126295